MKFEKLRARLLMASPKLKKILIFGTIVVTSAVAIGIGWYLLRPAITLALAENRLDRLDTNDFLYDFDFMMANLEENFPFFEISASANGLDLHELAASTREIIADTPNMHPLEFYDIISDGFFAQLNGDAGGVRGIGGLAILSVPRIGRTWHELNSIPENAPQWEQTIADRVSDQVRQMGTLAFYMELAERETGVGFVRVRGNYNMTTMNNDVNLYILEEDRIAYLGFGNIAFHFGGSAAYTRVQNFLENVNHFDHAIIDLRGASGDAYSFFMSVLLGHLVPVPVHTYVQIHPLQTQSNASFMRQDGFGAGEGITARTGGAFGQYYTMQVRTREITHFWHDASLYMQNAKIWVLVDENTRQGAENVALLLRDADFATVIGENTRGELIEFINFPASNFIALPNSGIVVAHDFAIIKDIDGNIVSGYGIVPNYFNNPGMDAMETALYMINDLQN